MEVYKPYMEHLRKTGKTIDQEAAPTMQDFYNELMNYPVPEAQNIAISLERYVKGALDIFAHKTNVEIDNRFTVYNIRDIGTGLKGNGPAYLPGQHLQQDDLKQEKRKKDLVLH